MFWPHQHGSRDIHRTADVGLDLLDLLAVEGLRGCVSLVLQIRGESLLLLEDLEARKELLRGGQLLAVLGIFFRQDDLH